MSYHKSENRSDDHAEKHKCCKVISRLHEKPHRHNRCRKKICHDNVIPLWRSEIHRHSHSCCEHDYKKSDGQHNSQAFLHIFEALFNKPESHSNEDKQH